MKVANLEVEQNKDEEYENPNYIPLGNKQNRSMGKQENVSIAILESFDSVNQYDYDECGTGRSQVYTEYSRRNEATGISELMCNLDREEGINNDQSEYGDSDSEDSDIDYPCYDRSKVAVRNAWNERQDKLISENMQKESECNEKNSIHGENVLQVECRELTLNDLLNNFMMTPVITLGVWVLTAFFILMFTLGFIVDYNVQTSSFIVLMICLGLIQINAPIKKIYMKKGFNGKPIYQVATLKDNLCNSSTKSVLSQYSMNNPKSHNYAAPGQRDAIGADLYEKRPYVKVTLHGALDRYALLDSGASISVIASQLVREIECKTQSILPRLQTDCVIRGIGNMAVEHSGAVLLSVKIGETTYKLQPFIISECPNSSQLIIGSRMIIRKRLLPTFEGDQLVIKFGDKSKKPIKVHLFGGNDHRLANCEEIACIMPNEIRVANLQFYDAPDVDNNFMGKDILITKNHEFHDFPIEIGSVSTVKGKGIIEVSIRNNGDIPICIPAHAEIATGEIIDEEKLVKMDPLIPAKDESCDPQSLEHCLCKVDYVFMLSDYQGFTQFGSRFEYRNLDNMVIEDTVKPGVHFIGDKKAVFVPSKEGRFDLFDESVIHQVYKKFSTSQQGGRIECILLYEKPSFFNDSTLQLISRLRVKFKVKLRVMDGLKEDCKVCKQDKLSFVINEVFSRTIPDVRIFVCHTDLYPEEWAMMIDDSHVSVLNLNGLMVSYFQTDLNTMCFIMHFGQEKLSNSKYVYSGVLLLLNQIKPSFPKTRLEIGMTKTSDDTYNNLRLAMQDAIRDSKYLTAHLDESWKRPIRKGAKDVIRKVKAPLRISGCSCMICSNITGDSVGFDDKSKIEIVYYNKFPSDFSYLKHGKESILEIANLDETGIESMEDQAFDCDLMLYNDRCVSSYTPYPKPVKNNVKDPLSYFDLSEVPNEVIEETKQLILDFADSVISFDKADYMPMKKYVANIKIKG